VTRSPCRSRSASDLLVLARITAATMAARADFDIEEIEDLRLAVDELCFVGGGRGPGRETVRLEFTLDDATIAITCELDRRGEARRWLRARGAR